MAKIKIENVPEVATISKLLGVDSNNKWAKINGGAYSTPADVAEAIKPVKQSADNAVAAANAATNTANSAKTTAEGIAETANDAKTQSTQAVNTATTAKTSAEKNNDLLMGAVKWNEAGDITIYSGNWVNGTLDPKEATGQINSKFRCLHLEYRQEASRTLTLKGLMNFVAKNLHARLTVAVEGGGNLVLTEPSEGIQGTIVPINPTNLRGLAMYVFSIELCETYCVVDCLYNCTFEQAQPMQLLLNAERGTDIEVDSALSTTSENPVQNKAVAEALALKASIDNLAYKKVYFINTRTDVNVPASFTDNGCTTIIVAGYQPSSTYTMRFPIDSLYKPGFLLDVMVLIWTTPTKIIVINSSSGNTIGTLSRPAGGFVLRIGGTSSTASVNYEIVTYGGASLEQPVAAALSIEKQGMIENSQDDNKNTNTQVKADALESVESQPETADGSETEQPTATDDDNPQSDEPENEV